MILTIQVNQGGEIAGPGRSVKTPAQDSQVPVKLTSREVETLHYVSYGLTSYEIADALNLGRETIETHRRKIMRKLNANNIVHAVALGFREKIIQ